MRLLIILFALGLSASAQDRFHSSLNKYCLECHGGRKTKGGVNFKNYQNEQHIYKHYRLWEKALEQLKTEEMPPQDEAQMSSTDKAYFIKKV